MQPGFVATPLLPRPSYLVPWSSPLPPTAVQVTYQAGVPPRPVALVQLAAPDRSSPAGVSVLLLHVAVAGLPPSLRALLVAPAPLKVGCGAHGDALKVRRLRREALGGDAVVSPAMSLAALLQPPACTHLVLCLGSCLMGVPTAGAPQLLRRCGGC